jgi:hypothetical protein
MHLLQLTGMPIPRIFGMATIEPPIVIEHLVGTGQLSLLGTKALDDLEGGKKPCSASSQLHSTADQIRPCHCFG